MAKKREIQTHFEALWVEVIPGTWSGYEEFNVKDLDPNAKYRVLATFTKIYDDGSNEPVFLIEGPDGNISTRACKKFRVSRIK